VGAVVDTKDRPGSSVDHQRHATIKQRRRRRRRKTVVGWLALINDDYAATPRVPVDRRPGHWTGHPFAPRPPNGHLSFRSAECRRTTPPSACRRRENINVTKCPLVARSLPALIQQLIVSKHPTEQTSPPTPTPLVPPPHHLINLLWRCCWTEDRHHLSIIGVVLLISRTSPERMTGKNKATCTA